MPAVFADLTALSNDLSLAGQRADYAMAGLLRTAAVNIQHVAQQNAPVKTGALRSSIQITVHGPTHIEIGPTVNYGAFQEFGTRGPYKIVPRKPGGRLVFTVNGTVVYAKSVTHPGVKAQPYMRPAFEEVLGDLVRNTQSLGVRVIVAGDTNAN